jgi:hypothetical protein
MAHTYMIFEFPDEEKAQQARHKLEGWKQAFRLDKKLQVKFDRGDEVAAEGAEDSEPEADAAEASKKSEKSKAKASKSQKGDGTAGGPVELIVRLYFSGHEKLKEQQATDRISGDEIFKKASPKVVHEGQAGFEDLLKRFDELA